MLRLTVILRRTYLLCVISSLVMATYRFRWLTLYTPLYFISYGRECQTNCTVEVWNCCLRGKKDFFLQIDINRNYICNSKKNLWNADRLFLQLEACFLNHIIKLNYRHSNIHGTVEFFFINILLAVHLPRYSFASLFVPSEWNNVWSNNSICSEVVLIMK